MIRVDVQGESGVADHLLLVPVGELIAGGDVVGRVDCGGALVEEEADPAEFSEGSALASVVLALVAASVAHGEGGSHGLFWEVGGFRCMQGRPVGGGFVQLLKKAGKAGTDCWLEVPQRCVAYHLVSEGR